MGYFDVSLLAGDGDFASRCMACYATEPGSDRDPSAWWSDHVWQLAAAPGFGDAYASARASQHADPGRDPAVISDAQILTAVQTLAKGHTDADHA